LALTSVPHARAATSKGKIAGIGIT